MRISVTHSTIYHYSQPIYLEPHLLRLCPRQDGTQRLERFSLDISPLPAGRTECLDQDGNRAISAWFREPTESLQVRSSFEVETLRQNPFDYFVTVPSTLPLAYDPLLRAALAPYLVSEIADPVREFAESFAQQSGGKMLAFLGALNQHLFENFGHSVRSDGPPEPAESTLRERQGSCRDLATLFCDACRALGIAARFVSGYECEAATQECAYMHAWPEVYIPGGGWRGYDPTQGLAVADSHIAIAAAAHPALAAPVTGTYRGLAEARMEFAIELVVNGAR